jgi:hypothetical protein
MKSEPMLLAGNNIRRISPFLEGSLGEIDPWAEPQEYLGICYRNYCLVHHGTGCPGHLCCIRGPRASHAASGSGGSAV